MAFVENDGWKIWFEETGEGQPLILCGGPIMLHDQFGRASSLLARHFRVLNWNWRGVGNSSRNWTSGLKFDDWIDDLVSVMDSADIAKADFWGVSSGSQFAIRLARRFPERVGKLVLYPSIYGPSADVARMKAEVCRRQGLEQLVWSGFWQAASAESFEDGSIVQTALHEVEVAKRHMSADILPRAHALYTDLDLTCDIASLAGPVLLLLGKSGRLGADAPTMIGLIKQFCELCPQAQLVTIARTGGTMAAVEAPELCVEAVRSFLQGDASGNALSRRDGI